MPNELVPYDMEQLSAELEEALSDIIQQERLEEEEARVVRKFLILSDIPRVAEELNLTHSKVQKILQEAHIQKYIKRIVKNNLTMGALRMARLLQRLEDMAMADITKIVTQVTDEEEFPRFVLNKNLPESMTGAIKSLKVRAGSVEVVLEDRNSAMEKWMELIKLQLGVESSNGVNVNIFNNSANQKAQEEREIHQLNQRFKNVQKPQEAEVVEPEEEEDE